LQAQVRTRARLHDHLDQNRNFRRRWHDGIPCFRSLDDGNILQHSWVPQHIKLKESEKEELFKKFNISTNSQLPQISRFDPVARAILLRPGEVCKIIRHDKISLINEFYRICVG